MSEKSKLAELYKTICAILVRIMYFLQNSTVYK